MSVVLEPGSQKEFCSPCNDVNADKISDDHSLYVPRKWLKDSEHEQ